MLRQLWSMSFARLYFVAGFVPQLESSHPDVVEEMLASSTQMFPIGTDGVCRSGKSGSMQWAPRVSSAQLTEGFALHNHGASTTAAVSVGLADAFITYGQPYCAELPAAMLELIKAEPDGALGQTYQRYVRTALLPGVRFLAEIMQVHGATIGATPTGNFWIFCLLGVVIAKSASCAHNFQPTSISQCLRRMAIGDVAKRKVPCPT